MEDKYKTGKVEEITAEQFDNFLGALPPIYLTDINGKKHRNMFAVSEAVSYEQGADTFTICWIEGEKYYSTIARLYAHDKPLGSNYNRYEYTHICRAEFTPR